jgi:uridine monophosphate synthetase
VGLDPHPELLVEASAPKAREFCLRLIETTAEYACAFKPNSAFFEAYGAPGWAALRDVIAAVPDGIPVILDAKRGDIASTARAYAQAVFGWLEADAVTVSPYLGHDAVEPFIADPARGIFLLCKTSNPGAEDLQSHSLGGEALYLRVARLATAWNTKDNLGLVVGATDPEALTAVRTLAPDLWILAPGVGPQGADLEAALRSGLREDGAGLLVAVSRAIAQAESPAQEAARMKALVNGIRDKVASQPGRTSRSASHSSDIPELSPRLASLADGLLQAGCVQFGEYKLKSGEQSPIYFDLRLLTGDPALLRQVAAAYLPLLAGLSFDRLAAVPYAGLPIATALSLQSGDPLVYPRKELKDYGTGAVVEGGFKPGEVALLIDDLATSGGSKFEAIERLGSAGLTVQDVVVLIDRQAGARQALAHAGLRLHAVFTIAQLLDHWELTGAVGVDDVANVREYIAREQG